MTDPTRYAVIGTGMMGIEHMRNIALLPDAELVAAADPNDRSRTWAASAAGGTPIFGDYREMLDKVDADVLIIATPNHTHAAVLEDAFQYGKHILCEKPLCTTIEDCRRVVDRRSGRA